MSKPILTFNIGQAARSSGVNAKMIRHYEEIGLVPKPMRSDGNYRLYSENDIHTLRFIKQSRELGFSIKQIKTLLGLWRNRSRSSAEVKALALAHLKELESKIAELEAMAQTVRQLARRCHGDQRPECPILNTLER